MILITGSQGQLGKDLQKLYHSNELILIDIQEGEDVMNLDITDEDTIERIVDLKPQLIIHPAAYTDVDGCETNQELAYKVNADGTKNLCLAAKELNIPLFYASTDYVFNGQNSKPYEIDDEIDPQSIYGKSKAQGEKHVRDLLDKYFIGRTAWLYGWHGNNFVKTITKYAKEKGHLKVVDDQVGSPTFSLDLARKIKEITSTDKYGTYHLTNSGKTSWYGFTLEILKNTGVDAKIEPCTSDEYKRPAPRPQYSVLSEKALIENSFEPMKSWQEALKEYFENSE